MSTAGSILSPSASQVFRGGFPAWVSQSLPRVGLIKPQLKPHPMPWVQTEPVPASETAVPARGCPQHSCPPHAPAWSWMNRPQNTSSPWPWGKTPAGKATPGCAGIGPALHQHRSGAAAAPVAAPMGHDPKTHRWWVMPGQDPPLCDPRGVCF